MKYFKKFTFTLLASCLALTNITTSFAATNTTISNETPTNNIVINIETLDDLKQKLSKSLIDCNNNSYTFQFNTEIIFDSIEELNSFTDEIINNAFNDVNSFYRQNVLLRKYNTTYISTKYSNGVEKYKLSKININYVFKNTSDDLSKVDTMLKAALPTILGDAKTDYEKTKRIFKYVLDALEYQKDSVSTNVNDKENLQKLINERNLLKGITKQTGVCETYAMLMNKLLTMVNIESTIINGTYKGDKHSWVMVKLNNQWYHVDAVASDFSVQEIKKLLKQKYPKLNQSLINKNANINYQKNFYRYFLIADKHFNTYGYEWEKNNYPVATNSYKYPDYNLNK